jgi:Protein of unknown function (DUF3306)
VSESDNFILRWARLKHKAGAGQGAETVSAGDEAATAQPRADAAIDEPFDLASLPSIESIAADTDIAAFLQSGVPAELARAALRRAWESDPAIRDFIGIAENQWDFNDPEAIPGFGPLLATDSAPAVLTRVKGELDKMQDGLREMPASVEYARSGAISPECFEVDPDAQATPDDSRSTESGISSVSSETREAGAKTECTGAVQEHGAYRNLRRHGSALPK